MVSFTAASSICALSPAHLLFLDLIALTSDRKHEVTMTKLLGEELLHLNKSPELHTIAKLETCIFDSTACPMYREQTSHIQDPEEDYGRPYSASFDTNLLQEFKMHNAVECTPHMGQKARDKHRK
jgi:hypothetical protein